ncbi:hypothetical protein FBY22_0010 [Streptomyces sp. SLBN-31]|nr:hypothetical protein FBY22_0010 [Streptomyces sp. SLBN-31]
MRSCIQATTLRSQTMENSTVHIRKAKQKTALTTTSHQGSVPNIERSSAAKYGLIPPPPSGPRRRSSPGRCGRGAGQRPGVGGDSPADGVQREPDHPVGHLAVCRGSSTAPAGSGHGEEIAVLDAHLGRRRGRHARVGGVPGAGERLVALLQDAPVEQEAGARRVRPPRPRAWATGPRSPEVRRRAARPRDRAGRSRSARCAGPADPGARPWRRPASAAHARRSARGGGSSARA